MILCNPLFTHCRTVNKHGGYLLLRRTVQQICEQVVILDYSNFSVEFFFTQFISILI